MAGQIWVDYAGEMQVRVVNRSLVLCGGPAIRRCRNIEAASASRGKPSTVAAEVESLFVLASRDVSSSSQTGPEEELESWRRPRG